jgi:hypothetical protein
MSIFSSSVTLVPYQFNGGAKYAKRGLPLAPWF